MKYGSFFEGRQGAIGEEMVYLENAIEKSSGKGTDAGADAEAAHTVTKSSKEQIVRCVKQ
jgi:hypothetical protein